MPTEAVEMAAVEIKLAVEKMLTELPKDTNLEVVTEELILALGSSCPQMGKFVTGALAARQALIEMGVSPD